MKAPNTGNQQTYFTDNNTRYVFLDGTANGQLSGLFANLDQQLSFPDYFGNNLDALEEVLNDLEWIKEGKIKIVIQHLAALLAAEPAKKKAFLEILKECENKRLEVFFL